ncbi:hypothetical protein [Kitasatospora sp. NPDC058218]|uniref:hypothetical protein n=1 Tax=Kitasatospora sp. NPDC058218 TaxID=3346385 RepID=UPI0036DBAD61
MVTPPAHRVALRDAYQWRSHVVELCAAEQLAKPGRSVHPTRSTVRAPLPLPGDGER